MSIKVLLVDDEVDFVDALAERLEIRGLSVSRAYDGNKALALVHDEPFDVVVLDVEMPGKSGNEVLAVIKEKQPLVEVIMLTGKATVPIAISGMKLGAFDFLLKPTETEALLVKIQAAYEIKADHEERIRQAEIANIIEHRGW